MLGGAAGAVLAVVDVPVIMQRRGVSRTVKVPQIQFIAPFEDTQLRNRDGYAQCKLCSVMQGYGGDEWVFRPF